MLSWECKARHSLTLPLPAPLASQIASHRNPGSPAPSPPQLSLGNCQKSQLHIHASLGTGLHEGNAILLPGRECSQGLLWPPSPFPQTHWQSLTLASVSPSSERITLSLLTSACQAHVGQSINSRERKP